MEARRAPRRGLLEHPVRTPGPPPVVYKGMPLLIEETVVVEPNAARAPRLNGRRAGRVPHVNVPALKDGNIRRAL